MTSDHLDVADSLRGLPSSIRSTIGIVVAAVASYYFTQILLVLLGQTTAPLFDVVGAAIGILVLALAGVVVVVTRKPLVASLLFMAVGFVYIVYSLRFASGDPLAVARQVIFHTLPFALNGFMLLKWSKYVEDEQPQTG